VCKKGIGRAKKKDKRVTLKLNETKRTTRSKVRGTRKMQSEQEKSTKKAERNNRVREKKER